MSGPYRDSSCLNEDDLTLAALKFAEEVREHGRVSPQAIRAVKDLYSEAIQYAKCVSYCEASKRG